MIYIYSNNSPFVEELYHQGLIDKAVNKLPATYEGLEKLVTPFVEDGLILIIDDGLSQIENYLPKVFEEFASKNNTSVIFVSQSIFVDDKNFIRMSQNSHYIVCTANRRNTTRIRTLALQIESCKTDFILKCFRDATKFKPLSNPPPKNVGYGYFIFEFNLKSPLVLSYRTNIFPDEKEPLTVYVEK